MAWAPSTSTGTPCLWAISIMCFTGLMVPSTFETCVMATSFVFLLRNFLYSARSSSPSSLKGITFNTAPFSSQTTCQGTRLEWCSISEMITSSPASRLGLANECAIRFTASVAPFVNIISRVSSALIHSLTVFLAFSKASVACWLR